MDGIGHSIKMRKRSSDLHQSLTTGGVKFLWKMLYQCHFIDAFIIHCWMKISSISFHSCLSWKTLIQYIYLNFLSFDRSFDFFVFFSNLSDIIKIFNMFIRACKSLYCKSRLYRYCTIIFTPRENKALKFIPNDLKLTIHDKNRLLTAPIVNDW